MSTVSQLKHQDYQFQATVATGNWSWTTRVDLSLSVPSYSVKNILSPFGWFRDSLHIPGDIIQAMADSITTLQQSFPPHILLSPTTLIFTVDQGRGVSDSQTILVTNNGVYGSLLGVTITGADAFVFPSPSSVGSLPHNGSGQFLVAVDSTGLLATNSPYSTSLTVQDVNASNTPQTIPVSVVVRPIATINIPTTSLDFTVIAPLSGPFPTIPTQDFVLQNTGLSASLLGYSVKKLLNCTPWLTTISPVSGSLYGGTTQNITVTVAPPQYTLPGTYNEIIRVSGYSTNFQADIPITLTVT